MPRWSLLRARQLDFRGAGDLSQPLVFLLDRGTPTHVDRQVQDGADLRPAQEHGLVQNARTVGAHLLAGLRGLMAKHAIVGDVRGLGLMAGVELVSDKATKQSFDVAEGAARRVWLEALEHGVIVRPIAGDVIAISPPFVISEQQIDRIVEVLHGAIESVGSQLRRPD